METNYNDIMLDIETFGTTYNSAVVQVAMIYFNRETGQLGNHLVVNLDINDSIENGFELTKETIEWWEQQPKEIFESLSENPFKLKEGLKLIKDFFQFGSIIWCHSTFDVPLLGNVYMRMGEKLPWGYKNVRDIRTLCELSNIDLSLYDWEKEKTHNALSDVKFQVKYVTDACNMIKYKCSQEQAIQVRNQVQQMLLENQ